MTAASWMRAAILRAPLDLRVEDAPVPEISDDDLLIRVRSALTCGTDQKAYLRGHPKIKIPGPLGHEFSGEIARVGKSVRGFSVGDRVACVHTGPCGRCFFCSKQQPNLCDSLTDRMAYGAYAQYIKIPPHVHAQNCLPLPASMSFDAGALMEPLACCVHGMNVVDVSEGESVLILGDGPIGLMMTCLARHRKARSIGVVGKYPARLNAAARLGAHLTFDATVSPESLKSAFPPHGPDVVIEGVGRGVVWEKALAAVRPGGRILLFGGCPPDERVPIDPGIIHYGNLTVYGTFHFAPPDVRQALDLLESGVVPAVDLISDRVPLSEIPKYFSARGRKDYLKVAFIP